MVVRNQDIIDDIGQIHVGKTIHRMFVSIIADEWIHEDAHVFGFDEDTGVSEVSHPDFVAGVVFISGWGHFGEQLFEQPFLNWVQLKQGFDFREGLRGALHLADGVDERVVKGDGQVQHLGLVQSGGTQHKRPIVVFGEPKGETLQRLVVEGAVIEQGLKKSVGDVMVEVVYQFHVAFERVGYFFVGAFQRIPFGMLPEHGLEFTNGFGQIEEVGAFVEGLVAQGSNGLHVLWRNVHKRPAEHFRVFDGGGMDLWRLDKRVHDF